MGATNRVDAVDGALRRPGRFDRELLFPLPNASARAEILGIHTRSWAAESRPSRVLVSELAARTAGYGGADLKALTAEASLRALRRTFPQIYESETRVPAVDASAVVVRRRDFVGALRAIVPSSHRAAAAHARPLAAAHSGALGPQLRGLVRGVKAAFGPAASVIAATAKAASVGVVGPETASGNKSDDDDDEFLDDDDGDDSDGDEMMPLGAHAPGAANTANADPEKAATSPSARLLLAGGSSKGAERRGALAPPPPPPPPRAARAVVCGPAGCGASDVAAALLAALEGLPLHSLGLPCLLSDGGGGGGGMHGADEALVRAFAAARRAAPSVLFLPQADLWWSAAPRSLRAALRACLSEVPPGCPVLLVASADCRAAELPAALAALLGVGGGNAPAASTSSSSSAAAAALNTVLVELSAPDAAGRAGALAAAASELARPPARRVRKTQMLLPTSEGEEAAAAPAPAAATAPAVAAAAPAAAAVAAAPNKPSAADKAARLAADDAALRALRVALRSVASRLLLDRRFVSFSEPRPPSEDDSADEDDEDEELEAPTMASVLAKVDARQCPTVSSFLELVAAIPAHALAMAERKGKVGGKGKSRASVGVGAEATARATLAFALQDEAEGLVAARVPPGLGQRCEAIEEERKRRASAGEEEEEEVEEVEAEAEPAAAAAAGEAAAATEEAAKEAADLAVVPVAAHLPPRRPALPPASEAELALSRKVLEAAVRATEGATLEGVGAASAALFAAARARRREEDREAVSKEVLVAVLGDAATL